jgi:small subunit ribosomal protein S4
MKLFLKGARCESEKCALARRDQPPGQLTSRRVKVSAFGEQLREKQKVKRFYGVLERQFLQYFAEASRSKGNTGESLLSFFERRLDNAVFKLGWAVSRAEARQMIAQGHISVNGRRVTVPSYRVSVGEELSVREGESSQKRARAALEMTKGRQCPAWMQPGQEKLGGKVVSLPAREDVSIPVSEQLIVELLSK